MRKIHVRLDDEDAEKLTSAIRSVPIGIAARLAILYWLDGKEEQPAHIGAHRDLALSDPDPDQDQKKKERYGEVERAHITLPNAPECAEVRQSAPVIPQVKRRSRQTPLIDDEAASVARRVVERVNALRGTRYATEGHTFEEVARNIRAHLKAGILEADIMLVVENRHARWGADEKMAENCNPVTITRKANLPRYLAEAKAEAPLAPGEKPKLSSLEIEEHIKRMEAQVLAPRNPKERWG